ncbi:UNVERIFIED_CONTAM: hypothetical protein Sindi_1080900, partial [Sesamum indicum]
MGFNEVYKYLQELFPMVDPRAIRAVALEHSNDAAAAVVAVVEEVIPFFIQRSRPSTPLSQSIYAGESSEAAPVVVPVETRTADAASVNTMVSAEVQDGYNVNTGNQQFFNDADDENNEPFYDTYDRCHEGDDNTNELILSEDKPVMLIDKNAVNTLQIEVSGDPGIEEKISGSSCPGSSIKFSSESNPHQMLTTMHDVDMGLNQKMNLVQERQDTSGHLERDSGTATDEENNLDKSSADGNNSMDETALLTGCDLTITSLKSSAQLVEVPHIDESNLDKLEVSLLTHTASKMETESSIFRHEDEPALNATMSQSSQIHSIDVLEEIIGDARNNK